MSDEFVRSPSLSSSNNPREIRVSSLLRSTEEVKRQIHGAEFSLAEIVAEVGRAIMELREQSYQGQVFIALDFDLFTAKVAGLTNDTDISDRVRDFCQDLVTAFDFSSQHTPTQMFLGDVNATQAVDQLSTDVILWFRSPRTPRQSMAFISFETSCQGNESPQEYLVLREGLAFSRSRFMNELQYRRFGNLSKLDQLTCMYVFLEATHQCLQEEV